MKRHISTRRDFLKAGAGMAAAGLAAPCLLTGAKATAAEPKYDLNVAAIGVGGRGTQIGKPAAALANMIACADVHLGNAEKFAAEVGGKCKAYQDYRKVLDRGDVDAVIIGTPDHWHAKIALDAMQAGKDVYCEKPLTLTIDEGRLICKAVKATGKVFQVGTQQRSEYHKYFLQAAAIARSGRLGDKLTATASVGEGTVGGPFAAAEPPKELNWDFWLGQAPQAAFSPERIGWNFRWWFDYSGGMVTDWGVHHTDIGLWALGGEETGVDDVEGKGVFPLGRELVRDYMLGRKTLADLPNSYNTAKSFDCTMNLPNGNVLKLNSGHNDLLIEGEKGRLAVNRAGLRGQFVEKLKSEPGGQDWLDEQVAKLYRHKPIRGHMANFYDCVLDRSLPISDVFTHCNSVNACHMANIAMLLGRKVAWDRDKHQFVGDEEANQLARRRQRKPYSIYI
ncbi:MAG: Gfo/Idh/MocA family oxidoreductase [Pirellulales bacterium]|nr:Gfo/Idh/MocA family oxidoreductase [Pirellulales bacterium]